MIPSFEQLLEVQKLDTTLAQLEYEKASLPQREEIAGFDGELATIQRASALVQAERDEVAKVEKRYEDEISLVEDKIAGLNEKLYAGSITSPKEAQTLQEEIASFGRQRSTIEDHVIDQMELAEPLDGQLMEFAESEAVIVSSLEVSHGRLTVEESAVDEKIAAALSAREQHAADVPAELLEAYDGAREQFGSSAVVVLEGSTCQGCPLAMPAMEVDRAKKAPADQLYSCEECGRFVVK